MSNLKQQDPELYSLIIEEKNRQKKSIELIASENYTSSAVQECLGSCLTNKYSEGKIGDRYYGGNEVIDQIESLCHQRALEAFNLNTDEWSVNVQPYSGSPANTAVYTALLHPHKRLMGLGLPSGGHLTHGFYTATRKVSATSIFWESLPYHVGEDGRIDYQGLEEKAKEFLPKLIITGASAYPRGWDWCRLRRIADDVGAWLMADIAHVSGLVATGNHASPFKYCDVVTTTTHKTLRGPRSGMVFCRNHLKHRIDAAVFPGLQGGPHNHQIAAVATQLREVATEGFRTYCEQIVTNSKYLARKLKEQGEKIATDGTDNHIVLWDLRPHGLTGSKLQLLLEHASISVNKNALPGDRSPASPGGVRLGTPAITSRGMDPSHVEQVVSFLVRGVAIALRIQRTTGKKIAPFKAALADDTELKTLQGEVEQFAQEFEMPGHALI